MPRRKRAQRICLCDCVPSVFLVVRHIDDLYFFRDLKKSFAVKKKKHRQAKKAGCSSEKDELMLPAYPEGSVPVFSKTDNENLREKLDQMLAWMQVFRYRLVIRETWDKAENYKQFYDHLIV